MGGYTGTHEQTVRLVEHTERLRWRGNVVPGPSDRVSEIYDGVDYEAVMQKSKATEAELKAGFG